MKSGQDYPALYAVITVTLLMLVISVRKGVVDVRDAVTRCPSCGKLRRRSRPCRCGTDHRSLD